VLFGAGRCRLGIGTGTDVAIEASDVTLIKGSLMCIITAIEISRATMRDNAQCPPELGRRVWLQRAWQPDTL
jgi:hypothetical protein